MELITKMWRSTATWIPYNGGSAERGLSCRENASLFQSYTRENSCIQEYMYHTNCMWWWKGQTIGKGMDLRELGSWRIGLNVIKRHDNFKSRKNQLTHSKLFLSEISETWFMSNFRSFPVDNQYEMLQHHWCLYETLDLV